MTMTPADRRRFEEIKQAVGRAMLNPKASSSKIMQDFEWLVALTITLIPDEETPHST